MELLYGKYLKSLEDEVFRRIGKFLENNTKAYVIVPSQAKFLMESQIIERCGVSGFLLLDVISFEKLTEYVLDRVSGRAIARVSTVGVSMLVREILHELQDELTTLDAEKDDTLHEAVAKLILALKTEDITPEDLLGMAEHRRGSIAEKLRDIAAVYRRLGEYHDAGIWDANRAEEYAREHLGELADIAGTEVIIHGFDMIPAGRIRTIAALLRAGCRITVTLEADEEDPVFARQLRTMYALEGAARAGGSTLEKHCIAENIKKHPEIAHIEEYMYTYPTREYDGAPERLSVARVKSRRDEITLAAQVILEHTGEMKLSDVAILAADPKRYAAAIHDIFPKAGLSWFFEDKRSLREHRLATFLLSAAEIFAEGNWRDVVHHIKTGFLPIDDEEADALLRYAAEHGKKPYHYKSPWKTAPEEIEEIRARALNHMIGCCERAKGADAAALAGILRDYLETSQVSEDLELEEAMLRELNMPAEAQFTAQLYEKTLGLLEQAERFGRGIPGKNLRAMLETGLNNTEISVIPQRREQVTVGDITHSIFPQKKLMIVLGANDGVLTSRVDGGLFSEREVEELNQDSFFPGYISIQDQRLFLRRAFTSSGELLITYNTDDGPAAMAVHRLHRLFPQLIEQGGRRLRTPEGILQRAAEELRLAADGRGDDLGACVSLMENEQGRELLEQLMQGTTENLPKQIAPETAQRIYERASNNVSRIETFYTCPYQQFIKYGLRPEIIREYEEGATEAGTYVHRLIEIVSGRMIRRGLEGLTDEELREMIEKTAQAERAEHNHGIFQESERYRHIEGYLKEEVFYALAAVRDQIAGTGIAIDGTEREFGGKTELTIDTPEGKVSLRGKIDRIDLLEEDGKRMVRVVDYKTGNGAYTLREQEICRGTSLQLVTYLMAVMSLYENAIPAGANYMKVRLKNADSAEARRNDYCLTGLVTKEGKERMNGNGCFKARAKTLEQEDLEALTDTVRELLGRAVRRIGEGENATEPADEKACAYCDYRGICRYDMENETEEETEQ